MSRSRKIVIGGNEIESYTNLTPMPQAVGGYDVGTTFDNVSFKDLMDGLLYPYQTPSFSSFYILNQSTTLECGVVVNGVNRVFNWNITNPNNVVQNSITIKNYTNNIVIGTNLNNDGSEVLSFSSITKTVTGSTHVWQIQAYNTKNQVFSKNYTITWYDPFYYGVGEKDLNAIQIQQLTKQVVSKSNKTYSFSPNNQVYYFAYPSSYGNLVSILDTNGFEILNDFSFRTVQFSSNPPYFNNSTIVNYNVYEFNNYTTQTNFSITFKFS